MLNGAVSIQKPIERLVNIDNTPSNEIANLSPERSRLGHRTLPDGHTDSFLVSIIDCQDEAIRKSVIEVNRDFFRLPRGIRGTNARDEAHCRVALRG